MVKDSGQCNRHALTGELRLRHVGRVPALGGRNLDAFVGPQRREGDVGLLRGQDVRQEVLGHAPVRVLLEGARRSQLGPLLEHSARSDNLPTSSRARGS